MGSIIGSIAPLCAPCNFPGDAIMYPSDGSSTHSIVAPLSECETQVMTMLSSGRGAQRTRGGPINRGKARRYVHQDGRSPCPGRSVLTSCLRPNLRLFLPDRRLP